VTTSPNVKFSLILHSCSEKHYTWTMQSTNVVANPAAGRYIALKYDEAFNRF
jgi:hypothetical protein